MVAPLAVLESLGTFFVASHLPDSPGDIAGAWFG